jgi:hypothetical protein
MKRAHRTLHRLVWPALALLIGFGLTLALVLRAPPPPVAVERQPVERQP